MKFRSSYVLLIVLVISSLMLAGCGGGTPAQEVVAPVATEAPDVTEEAPAQEFPPAPPYIALGASIPLTGKFGSLGNMVLPGYQFAIDAINGDGGVYVAEYGVSIPLRLTYYDDESDPARAAENLQTLYVNQDVVAYLGGASSDMHAATAAVAEDNQIPYLGVAFGLWQIHEQGYQYLFSPFPKSPDQASTVFDVLNSLPEDERPTGIAIFQETTDWGIELGGMWQEQATINGYDVVYIGEYAPSTEDFSQMILDAQAAGADALFALPNPPNAVAIINQMAELGWAPSFSLVIRGADDVTWGESMGIAGDYLTLFPGWHHDLDFPGVDELNATYQAAYGRASDVLTGPAYACVQILADAIERAGTLDRDAIRDAIGETDMMTVVGPVTFNPDGTGNVLNALVQWQNGVLALVWPPEQATSVLMYPAPPYEER